MTDRGVAALRPRAARYAVPDVELRGGSSGSKTYWTVTRNPDGKQVWTLVGNADTGLTALRESARAILARIRAGLPAFEPKAETYGAVVANWLKRHVENKGLRSRYQIERLLNVHILPVWKDREFTSIRRGDIAALLDTVEDDHGARQAEYCLAVIRGIANWYATRSEDYASPIIKGMRRINPKEHARSRVLTDEELRAVWKVAEASGAYGALVRLLLTTAQRREKVVSMRWSDIAMDGTWTIPAEAREKGNAKELLPPPLALDIIRAQPQLGDNPFVLAGRRGGHFKSYTKFKQAFDAKLAAELPDMPQWTLHDLRRTARSLMSRAGVLSEVAERVLGHAIAGVGGTYNRYPYGVEKADALKKLATLIDNIVNERSADVLPLAGRK
jgi:integrase